ncbi:hypothetical protein [Streptomyces phytophilus]|uniref:hypothetical protein n=1 Tax=Streptomyces phytophilus TaxID=722715 RepID=UPI0015EFE276|nr:hypothetical protein [Streptomyces phytophilus]
MARTLLNPPQLHDPTGCGYSHVATAPGEPVFVAQTLVGVASPALPEMLFEVDAVAVRAAPGAPAGPR